MLHPSKSGQPAPWWAFVAVLMVLASAAYSRRHAGPLLSTSAPGSNGFQTSAGLTPQTATPGSLVAIRASVISHSRADVLVDLEVHDAAGVKVFQTAFDGQTFNPGAEKTYRANWTVPHGAKPGLYRLTLGVFGPGWSGLVYWSNNAAVVAVNAASSSADAPVLGDNGATIAGRVPYRS